MHLREQAEQVTIISDAHSEIQIIIGNNVSPVLVRSVVGIVLAMGSMLLGIGTLTYIKASIWSLWVKFFFNLFCFLVAVYSIYKATHLKRP